MNNNQDNLNNNPQLNNINSLPNNGFGFSNNTNEPLNVIPQNQSINNQNNNFNQNINQGFTPMPTDNYAESSPIISQNRFDNNFNQNVNNNQNNNLYDNVNNNFNNNFLVNDFTNNINNLNQPSTSNKYEEENILSMGQQNKFINNDIDTNNTTLNDLNIEGDNENYPKMDYTNDPKVQENIKENKKNTITITSEGKVFIIIIIVLLLFTFVMPYIFDFVRNIKYQ